MPNNARAKGLFNDGRARKNLALENRKIKMDRLVCVGANNESHGKHCPGRRSLRTRSSADLCCYGASLACWFDSLVSSGLTMRQYCTDSPPGSVEFHEPFALLELMGTDDHKIKNKKKTPTREKQKMEDE